jgi:hypothetical protein
MAAFRDLLHAGQEELVQQFYKFKDDAGSMANRLEEVGKRLSLRPEQLVCAVGFNPGARFVTEIMPIIGFATFEELVHQRNEVFTTDIYRRVPLDDVLLVYQSVKYDAKTLEVMQYLLKQRLERVEQRIEETVNSLIIEKYKTEIRAIYGDGIAGVEFAEERLNRKDSGFRALLNEVGIIIEARLIPAGDIFFRETILPEEKRKILGTGLIPRDLIQTRLDEENIPAEERKVLLDYLRLQKQPGPGVQ